MREERRETNEEWREKREKGGENIDRIMKTDEREWRRGEKIQRTKARASEAARRSKEKRADKRAQNTTTRK